MTLDIIIYHNPGCGTSRNTLAMIQNAGIEPHVIEYLKTPPNRSRLVSLIGSMGITPRALLPILNPAGPTPPCGHKERTSPATEQPQSPRLRLPDLRRHP